MPKIKVFRSDIKRLLDSLPTSMRIVLKKDLTISMHSDLIMEHIDNKTVIGKEYYLQLAAIVYKKKKDKTWKKLGEGEGIIL